MLKLIIVHKTDVNLKVYLSMADERHPPSGYLLPQLTLYRQTNSIDGAHATALDI